MELPPLVPGTQEAPPAPAAMSLTARLFNIFAAPGEVFDAIKSARGSVANWLLPALLLILVSWAAGAIIFSRDFSQQQLNEVTMKALDKQLAKMPADQAERVREQALKYGSIGTKLSAAAAPVFVAFISPFGWGLILWLIGKRVYKGSFGYMKAVEVVGLGNMVVVLDAIVKSLLILGTANIFASPSLALLVKDFDPQNTSHALLAVFNFMTFWVLGVRSIGLARLSNVSVLKAGCWIFGIWACWTGVTVGSSLAMKAAFGG